MESTMQSQKRWRATMMDNYGTPDLALVRGQGCQVWDADGNTYLDLFAGIAVNALGHAHPAVVEAVCKQISVLGHTSNLFINEPALELAETLVELVGVPGKVMFVNSGAEANETAFKIARLTGRSKIVACVGAFHGRTMGALALTGQPAKRDLFAPMTPEVLHIPYGDVAALEAAVDSDTAAVFLEPILGEGGVLPAPDGYLHAARQITTRAGALLAIDEVQTGIGRTGSWFAYQRAGITPDLVTLAKGLGGGLPLGACIGIGPAGDLLHPGQHGSTFGGNPVCCAAGLAVLHTITEDKLIEHAETVGGELVSGIEKISHPLLNGVRGSGLLLGIALDKPISAKIAATARNAGYLVNNVQPDALRLAPPLILSAAQAQCFVTDLPNILDTALSTLEY